VRFGGITNDPRGNEKAGLTVAGKINRSDWGLIWNTATEISGLLVSEEVTISFEVELTNVSKREFTMELDPGSVKVGSL
jgi:polyisoprenoid-binding protein YceI